MKKLLVIAVALACGSAMVAKAADAKENLETGCAKGHGTDGKGDTKMGKKLGAKDYTDSKVQAGLKDAAAFKAIKEGLKNSDGMTVMKPTEGVTDDDINGLVAYMRSFAK